MNQRFTYSYSITWLAIMEYPLANANKNITGSTVINSVYFAIIAKNTSLSKSQNTLILYSYFDSAFAAVLYSLGYM